jgi:ribose transport system permease protein
MRRTQLVRLVGAYGVIVSLALLILFGYLRYDHFLGLYNVMTVLSYNSMFALVALGMCFVIMTGGIDLSVGSVAALGSVAAALASPYGPLAGLAAGVGVGLAAGLVNALLIVRLSMMPFIATLASMLAARGCALLLAGNQTIGAYDRSFAMLGQAKLGIFPIPAIIAVVAYVIGSVVLNVTSTGRPVLAVGDNEDASRLMRLRADREKFIVYLASGGLAGLAGVILAAQTGAGQPIEGNGWELFAIAAVVVGGTLLTGGSGSVVTTLACVLLLGILFNVLNFENGMGWISLSAYWQSVIRGVFLLAVILLQSRLSGRQAQKPA